MGTAESETKGQEVKEREYISLTEAGTRFILTLCQVEDVWGFIVSLVSYQHRGFSAIAGLLSVMDAEARQKYLAIVEKGPGKADELSRNEGLIFQMLFCRVIDGFLAYLSLLLASILQSKPEVLRSGDSIKVETVLQHDNMEDLIRDLAENKVYELSRKGSAEMERYFSERLGLKVFNADEDADEAMRYVQVRNLIVHNHGIVNKAFLQRVSNYPAKVGETVALSMDDVLDVMSVSAKVVCSLDVRAAKKFDLKTPTNAGDLARANQHYCVSRAYFDLQKAVNEERIAARTIESP